MYMMAVGVSVACLIKVGNFIGQGDKVAIKFYFNICMGLAILVGLF